MSIAFASKISSLRREKNITQKNAAEALGVSQALLSHYEKGIRECNLEFVKKAAVFYDVSADYLIGLSDTRHGNRDIFDDSDIPSDSSLQTTTVLRAFLYLMKQAEENGATEEEIFNNHFTLAIKKFIEKNNSERRNIFALCDMTSNSLPKTTYDIIPKEDIPQFIKTVDSSAAELISINIKKTIKL